MIWLITLSAIFSYIAITQAIKRQRTGRNWFHWAFCSVFATSGLLFSLATLLPYMAS
ncbi:hypothetical protein [Halomonas sp. DQ26W]|uniref:hypothetical protein n=1 Tax=Halomonas sp. DQ26W TaxID=2282311 RepID=UPI0015EFF82A|nr:hypothetical protein [Halomonas sp. DQ26W]